MSIIQIAKIQHRTGNLTDLPQLSEGEFGFATDTRQLFIGNDPLLYPPTNITSQTEVLTEHSIIRFSQVDGNGKDIFVDPNIPLVDGQIIRYDSTLDKWTVGGANTVGNINLGDITNVKVLGGAGGYTVETDGTGNLSWGHKGYAVSSISNINSASPATVTTTSPHFFLNSTPLTITDVIGAVTPANATGTITTLTTSNLVAGTGTSFDSTFVGKTLFTSANLVVGVVKSVANTVALTLKSVATSNLTNATFRTGNSPLNGITAYSKVLDENNFQLYSDSTLTTPISTTAYTVGYQSAGRVIGNVLPNSTGTAASGTNYAVQFAFNGVLANSAQLTYSAGGVLNAPRFAGNGSSLSSLTAANIVGNVPSAAFSTNSNNAAYAGNVTVASQANITTVGNLTNLKVVGNAIVGNSNITVTTRGTVVDAALQVNGNTVGKSSEVIGRFTNDAGEAKIWIGKSRGTNVGTYSAVLANDGLGSLVFGGSDNTKAIDGAAIVSHAVSNATTNSLAANLSFWTNDGGINSVRRMNIDHLGNIQMFGNLTVTGIINGSIQTAQTVTSSSQPNISSVGILSSLNVSGTSLLDDVTVNGNLVTANINSSTAIRSPLFIAGNASTNGNITLQSSTGNTFTILNNGILRFVTPGIPVTIGTNGDVTAGSFTGNFNGNGNGLFNIVAANIVGNVAYATSSGVAVTVSANAQPNIRSVGALINLAVTGEIVGGSNIVSSTNFIMRSGVSDVAKISYANTVTTFNGIGNSVALGTNSVDRLVVDTAGVVKVLSTTASTAKTNGAFIVAGGVGVGGNVYANVFYGAGSGLTGIAGANVVGTVPSATNAAVAVVAGTVTASAQSNITSVGTLVSANVAGVLNVGSATSGVSGYSVKNASNVLIGQNWSNGNLYKVEAIGNTVGIGLATNGGVRVSIGANGDTTFTNKIIASDATSSTNTTTGALTIAGGVGVGGNLNVGGSFVASSANIPTIIGNVTGNLSGVASFANQLSNNININGVPFNGTTSITIPDGRYKIQSGRNQVVSWTNIVDVFNYNSNYFDLFPPLGYTMQHLAGFTSSAARIYYAGDVNWDDITICEYSRLTDRIRVWVGNSEQRWPASANWIALWSPIPLTIDASSNEQYTTEPYASGAGGLAELGANFNNTLASYESYLGDGSGTITFHRDGRVSTSGTGVKLHDTITGRVWAAARTPTIGDRYWIRVSAQSISTTGNGGSVVFPTNWVKLSVDQVINATNVLTYFESSNFGQNPVLSCVLKIEIASNVQTWGASIIADGLIYLNVR